MSQTLDASVGQLIDTAPPRRDTWSRELRQSAIALGIAFFGATFASGYVWGVWSLGRLVWRQFVS